MEKITTPLGEASSSRAIRVQKVYVCNRYVHHIRHQPLDSIVRDLEPTLETLANGHHLAADLHLNDLAMRVESLEQQALKTIASAQIGAHRLSRQPVTGLEDR